MIRRTFLYAGLTGVLGSLMSLGLLNFRKEKRMLAIRRSNERGFADHGWLKSRHTFSFADYYDPAQMGFGDLRVINEDRIAGGTGFGTHPHNNMEIISYVISGGLKHQDSMGNITVIRPGEVQRMSAGTGVRHSEYNERSDEETHFFQIWVMPDVRGVEPGYGQKSFEKELREKNLVLVVSKDGRDGSITMNQDASIYISRLKKNESLDFNVKEYRRVWVQMVKGTATVNGQEIGTGDAAAAQDLETLKISASEDSEMIIFDLV